MGEDVVIGAGPSWWRHRLEADLLQRGLDVRSEHAPAEKVATLATEFGARVVVLDTGLPGNGCGAVAEVAEARCGPKAVVIGPVYPQIVQAGSAVLSAASAFGAGAGEQGVRRERRAVPLQRGRDLGRLIATDPQPLREG